MSSTRLPGKALATVLGRPLLGYVVSRVLLSNEVEEVKVATSRENSDDAIASFCRAEGIPCYRGKLEDVLDRYFCAAQESGADPVVRITADCPLIDPQVIDLVVSKYLEGNTDYASNTLERSYPTGLDTEVFSYAALERAWREATWRSEREHVTPYIRKHPEYFRLRNVSYESDLSAMPWTVDRPEDLEFVRQIYRWLDSPTAGMAQVLEVLKQHPETARLNAGIATNEGYARTSKNDFLVKGRSG